MYRQHENNVTPHFTTGKLAKIINKFKGKNYLLDKRLYLENKEFYRLNKNQMSIEMANIFDKYFKLENMKFMTRKVKLLFSKYTIANSSHMYFMIKVMVKTKFIGD